MSSQESENKKNKIKIPTAALIAFFAAVVSICAALLFFADGGDGQKIAVITIDGEEVERIDLGSVTEGYCIDIGDSNTAFVEHDKISMHSANCPDGLCVKQGAISSGLVPIVCLPNHVIIRIEDETSEQFDAVT